MNTYFVQTCIKISQFCLNHLAYLVTYFRRRTYVFTTLSKTFWDKFDYKIHVIPKKI